MKHPLDVVRIGAWNSLESLLMQGQNKSTKDSTVQETEIGLQDMDKDNDIKKDKTSSHEKGKGWWGDGGKDTAD